MKRIILIALSLILVISLSACSGRKADSAASTANDMKAEQRASFAGGAAPASSAPEAAVTSKNDVADAQAQEQPQGDRKVIYNASVTLDVKDLGKAYDSVISKAREMGGYISESGIYETSSVVTIRIPAGKMTDYLSYLDTLGGTRKEQNIKMEDVTDQYTDTQSRLKNLLAQEEQLLTIMKKAETIDEIMKVQNEIYRVRGDIEVLQGRINLWNNLIDLCTITIRLNKIAEIGGKEVSVSFITWGEMAKAMSNGFKSTLNFVVRFFTGFFVFIISIIPLVPFIALVVWIILRYRKKIIKRNSGK